MNPLPDLPDVQHPLTVLVKGLQSVAGDNAISGITLLSKYSSKNTCMLTFEFSCMCVSTVWVHCS